MRTHAVYLFAFQAICSLGASPTTGSSTLSSIPSIAPAAASVLPDSTSPTAPAIPSGAPTIQLDEGTFFGVSNGVTNSFLGIPFAQPPVGDLRFAPPQPNSPYKGVHNATYWGTQCLNTISITGTVLPSWATDEMKRYFAIFSTLAPSTFGEDCLNLNVIAPANIKAGQKLPIVAYIFFSGFDFSGSSNVDGRIMVNRSIEIGEPVIWVSMNYRLGSYGFLPGRQIREAGSGNMGLRDQREALRWIQKYIPAFGGDPSRVTLLGLSSGAASATLHTVANGGDSEGLFKGSWGESGALQHLGWIDSPLAQGIYDEFTEKLNCSDATDTLACLRQVPVENIKNVSASSADQFWLITADGDFIQEPPQQALVKGKLAPVAIVNGIAEDEGTIATLTFPDGANDTLLLNFIKQAFPNITDSQAQVVLDLYPDDPSEGAPYGTGSQYELAPMFKRIASIAGDIDFDSNHRLLGSFVANRQDFWSYYYTRNFVYGFGSTHGGEIPNMYGGGDMADLLIHFANTFDPNGPKPKTYWPKYRLAAPIMLLFSGNDTLSYKDDTYRSDQIDYLNHLNLAVH
ncbi:carotenoid ester lipase [Dichomitus squalens]|uniref:Carboxylic ester hydrolase n=1 Tax=Dichomitus squalens TaxID=114155 RepID=A0A4Q9MQT5_9APHY|nr:carotenoid ester lipase [Dichomitus squalens]